MVREQQDEVADDEGLEVREDDVLASLPEYHPVARLRKERAAAAAKVRADAERSKRPRAALSRKEEAKKTLMFRKWKGGQA
jgi:hypothetical protein